MSGERALVVDDEKGIRTFIEAVLRGEGLDVTLAADGAEARAALARSAFHLLITDLQMPHVDGMTLLRQARTDQPDMEVIVLTAHGTVPDAVEAMKLGTFDWLSKPVESPDALRLVVRRALERRALRVRDLAARAGTSPPPVPPRDPGMIELFRQLERVARTDATVLLLGESGVGKEVAAREVHARSGRRAGPFVAVNCAALTPELLASELFGHERGAFTGATARRTGRFELADGGTLFLDEVGELDRGIQATLLRVLQERTFERLGGQRQITVDVRLVAATNRDLRAEVAAGRFRDDLYHRLAVFPLELPPLRARPADIEPLADALLERAAARVGRRGLRLDASARTALTRYSWPGNVRELSNVLERAAILAPDSGVVTGSGLALPSSPAPAEPVEGLTLRDLERQAIVDALVATGGHRKQAAERLGMGVRTLYTKLREYGID